MGYYYGLHRPHEATHLILVDVNEPNDMVELLAQSVKVATAAINLDHWADYYWWGHKDSTHQVERKQWPEILPNLDKVEDQLDTERFQADTTTLMIEGLPVLTPYGVDSYSVSWSDSPKRRRPGPSLRRLWGTGSKTHPRINLYGRVMSWLYRLDRSGVTIVQTPNMQASAIALISMHNNSLKEEVAAFSRFFKPRVVAKKRQPYVTTLMGVQGGGIGEVSAKRLIKEFINPYNVFNAPTRDIINLLGPSRGAQFLKAIGRLG